MTAVSEREYAELLKRRPPHAIRTPQAYEDMMREIEALAIRGDANSEAESEYFLVLSALAAHYEHEAGFDAMPTLEPRVALRELMELKGITQADVARSLGDRAAASSILRGRRKISKAQAKVLGELFNVSPAIFI
jgi:HTH-type transcriptional regulator/antitoxin HigA